ncbi:alpha/beta fold hydrolase [Diaminobutyricibacter sp. McL0608]|uniref:alpha/beta fold hydrolase n=1 Tax=Leifsonia sp. McL0608 TaxID=3143537 RepID=UPI0031F2DEDC
MPTFTDEHGIAITYDVWPVSNPRAVIQIAHGVGEHAQRYAGLARHLNANGFAVYADDHRGHGRTGMAQWDGDATRLGHLGDGGLRAAVAAVRQFSGIIRDENPDLPLAILGHSWGSFMVQMILDHHSADYDLAVLSGSAYRLPGYLNSGDLKKRYAHLGTTGMEWLSRDPEVAQGFVDDPLTTSVPLAKLFGPADTLRIIGRPARNFARDLPLLLQVGGGDPVGGERSVRRLERAYRERSGLTDVTTIVYPDARHEVFNETNRADVMADLTVWLDARLARR